jgi:hypothetical protein
MLERLAADLVPSFEANGGTRRPFSPSSLQLASKVALPPAAVVSTHSVRSVAKRAR